LCAAARTGLDGVNAIFSCCSRSWLFMMILLYGQNVCRSVLEE
jgi:hypothetical protein